MSRRRKPPAAADPVAALDSLGAIWSGDLDAYATGQLAADQVTCALCTCAPCRCPAFGTPAYLALVEARHRQRRASRTGRGGPR